MSDTQASAGARTRRTPLEGATNFRDLGGYPTGDGRTVKWGMLFRSNGLFALTESDLDYLARNKFRLVCDFRSVEEQNTAPSRLPADDPPEVLSLSVRPQTGDQLRGLAMSEATTVADIVAAYADVYRAYARDHHDQFGAFLARLADADSYPAVFHCMAGKDRTGFAAAIILSALGVPRELVFEDYLLTNTHWALRARFPDAMDAEAQAAFGAARREYLEAAFDEIHGSHDSLDSYVQDALGVTETARENLRTHLLE
jgi:protein-tyrosine phosphatase